MRQIVCGVLAAITASSLVMAATSVRAQAAGERSFAASGFDAIETNASDNVEVTFGRSPTVIARGDPLAVNSLAIEVRGTTLHIGRTTGVHQDRGATVYVTMPSLRAAFLEGSGSITAPSLAADHFFGTISGSGKLELSKIRVREAKLSVFGSGTIDADGSAEALDLNMGGSGKIDTGRLKTADASIESAGSGSIVAAVSRTARVRIFGSGNIDVIGHPSCQLSGTGIAHVTCG